MVPYLDRDAPWVRTRDTRIFRGHLLTLGYPSSSQESAHFGIPFEFIGTTDCKDSSVPFGVPLLGPRHTLGLNQVTCLPALNLTFPSGAFVPLLGINSMSETLPASNQGLQCSRGPVPGLTGIFSLIRGTTVWTETQPAFKPGMPSSPSTCAGTHGKAHSTVETRNASWRHVFFILQHVPNYPRSNITTLTPTLFGERVVGTCCRIKKRMEAPLRSLQLTLWYP
nr:uncharacterized protein LOC119622309 isoform X2 [Chlorocebus sabaeus]